MKFDGKLDVRLVSADLSKMVSEEDVKTKVRIEIDGIRLGSSELETGPQAEWGEKLSAEVASVSELRAVVYSHSDREGETILGQGQLGLRYQTSEKETSQYTLELTPVGQILLEVTFHPRQKLEEKGYHHRGHSYKIISFCDPIKCAFCQVPEHQQILTPSNI